MLQFRDEQGRPTTVGASAPLPTTANQQPGSRWFMESNTPLAASASFTTPARDLGGSNTGGTVLAKTFRFELETDQPGTSYLEKSFDGVTWYAVGIYNHTSVPFGAAFVIGARYYRVRIVNGATAQGYMALTTTIGY